MAIVNNNNHNKIKLRLSKSEYWDFVLAKSYEPSRLLDGSFFYDENLISYIDISDDRCIDGRSVLGLSGYTWPESKNDGLLLKNIGLTCLDNGLISVDRNSLSDEEFAVVLTGSSLHIPSGDTRLVLSMVSGNTGNYTYPIDRIDDVNGDYLKLDGGFYQGFFKSGDVYSVLPHEMTDEITFDFLLKPDFLSIVNETTLNYKYPNNKGLFFYIGIRAENKFWYDYHSDDKGVFDTIRTGRTTPDAGNIYFDSEKSYFDTQDVTKIETDNKFLTFNRTHGGNRASTYDGSTSDFYIQNGEDVNYYNSFNRTRTGVTVNNIALLGDSNKTKYNVVSDITRNALAFRIKDNGSIGYRTIVDDCDSELGYRIIEDYSPENLIFDNALTFITVRIKTYGEVMKLMFYVSGRLVLVSKEIPSMVLRGMNDAEFKQETIPYSISFGGGTQGLCDMIGLNSAYDTEYLLPIESNFAGSFIGSLFKFRVFYGRTDYSIIKNNVKYEYDYMFNANYILPTLDFWIEGGTGKREVGDTTSVLLANAVLNDTYHPITGYKLYYSINNNNDRLQINGLFPMAQEGGSVSYTHTPNENNINKIRYVFELMDTHNSEVGLIRTKTINFDYMIFYGATSREPVTSEDVRSLPNSVFSEDITKFNLNTYSRDKVFSIAMPTTKRLFKVEDANVMFLDITDMFIESIVDVSDASGDMLKYRVYSMRNAIPYSSNHILAVTINTIDESQTYEVPYFDYLLSSLPPVVEVGTTISGIIQFDFKVQNIENAKPNSISIIDAVTNRIILTDSSLVSLANADIGDIKYSQANSIHSWKASVEDSNSELFYSEETEIMWKMKTFFGSSDSTPLSSEDIRGLSGWVWDDAKTFSIVIDKLNYCIALKSELTIKNIITVNTENITSNFIERPSFVNVYMADQETYAEYRVYDFKIVTPISGGLSATVTLN